MFPSRNTSNKQGVSSLILSALGFLIVFFPIVGYCRDPDQAQATNLPYQKVDPPFVAPAGKHWELQPVQDSSEKFDYVLVPDRLTSKLPLSHKKDSSVRVPFRMEDNQIIVPVELAGKKLECLLDTGSSILLWPEWLGLKGKSFPALELPFFDAAGTAIIAHPVQLPSVRIGTYEVSNLLTFSASIRENGVDKKPVDLYQFPLLNCAIFRKTILTVDYEKKLLVITPKDNTSNGNASLTEFTATSDDIVLPMKMDSPEEYGVPLITVFMDGRKAQMLLDTGWNRSTVGLTPKFYKTLMQRRKDLGLPSKIDKTDFLDSYHKPLKIERLFDIPVSFSDSPTSSLNTKYSYKTVGEVTPLPGALYDGVLGWGFLSRFRRVTLDFLQNRLILTP